MEARTAQGGGLSAPKGACAGDKQGPCERLGVGAESDAGTQAWARQDSLPAGAPPQSPRAMERGTHN